MQTARKDIQDYLETNVNTFIQPLVYDVVKNRPKDPVNYAIKWLQNLAAQKKLTDPQSDDDTVEELPFDDAKLKKKKLQGKARSRMGISSEVYGDYNRSEGSKLKIVPKNGETKLLIQSLIRSSILFQNVDEKDEETIVNAMEEKITAQGNVIIKENDMGDALYIVESGTYDCYKLINGTETYLKSYGHGEAFGQLALMYNAPRAATIITKEAGKIYSLDRQTFSSVVKAAAAKRRQLYKSIIESIDIFSDLGANEKDQFYDVLKEEKYEAGQYVIKQGDQGNKFYIIVEGNLVAEKQETDGQLPKVVYKYKPNEYFGELALVHDINRQASIKALSRVKVASIEREAFKRILGSLEEILQRNEEKYKVIQERMISCA